MDSEEHRAKCEANWLAGLGAKREGSRGDPAKIRSQLELTEKRRGKEAADKLRQAVREIWKERAK